MKGSEVLKALEEGKKMRIKDWRQHEYIELKDNELVDEEGIDQDMLGLNIFLKGEWGEYKEPLQKGDFVVGRLYDGEELISVLHHIENENMVYAIWREDQGLTWLYLDNVRKATKEEIKQELERRKWNKIGREVNEYKKDDFIGWNGKFISLLETEVKSGSVYFADIRERVPLTDVKLICPAENRFDK